MGTTVTTALGNTYTVPDDNETDWGESQVGPALVELLRNSMLSGGNTPGLKLVGPLVTTPITMAVVGGQTLPSSSPLYFISGLSSAVTLSISAPIQNGAQPGQHLLLIGTADARPVIIPDQGNVNLNGPASLGADQVLNLVWTGNLWAEIGRTS